MKDRFTEYKGKKTGIFRLLKAYRMYCAEFGEEYSFSAVSALRLLGRCLPGFVMLYDRRRRQVAAYAAIASLTEEAYGRYSRGEIGYSDFTPSMIRHLGKGGAPHCLYFAVLQKNPGYDGREILGRMLSLIAGNIAELAEKGVKVRCVIANAASEYGCRMCRMAGMRYLGEAKEGGSLYEGTLCPVGIRLPRKAMKRLEEVYGETGNG